MPDHVTMVCIKPTYHEMTLHNCRISRFTITHNIASIELIGDIPHCEGAAIDFRFSADGLVLRIEKSEV